MAFPETSILDSGVGADANPIAGNWSTKVISSYGDVRRLSNKFAGTVATPTGNDAWWNVRTFGPDSEAFVTISTLPTAPTVSVYARIVNPNVANSTNGYAVSAAIAGAVQVYRLDNSVFTQLGADIPQANVAGDSVGIEIRGSTISAYYKVGAGTWTSVGTRTDTTYNAAGFIGLELDDDIARLTNFGGGTISKLKRNSSLTGLGASGSFFHNPIN